MENLNTHCKKPLKEFLWAAAWQASLEEIHGQPHPQAWELAQPDGDRDGDIFVAVLGTGLRRGYRIVTGSWGGVEVVSEAEGEDDQQVFHDR